MPSKLCGARFWVLHRNPRHARAMKQSILKRPRGPHSDIAVGIERASCGNSRHHSKWPQRA